MNKKEKERILRIGNSVQKGIKKRERKNLIIGLVITGVIFAIIIVNIWIVKLAIQALQKYIAS